MMGVQPVGFHRTLPCISNHFSSYPPMPAGSVFFHERYPSLTVFMLFLLYFFTLLQPVAAVLKNVTIDDQKGDARTGTAPIFAPDFAWANQACVGCKVGYDPGRLFDNTATAATFMSDKGVINNTAEFDFNGMINH